MTSDRVVSFSKNGNASTTPHCSLPRVWLEILGINTDHRLITMTLDTDNKQIIIKKKE